MPFLPPSQSKVSHCASFLSFSLFFSCSSGGGGVSAVWQISIARTPPFWRNPPFLAWKKMLFPTVPSHTYTSQILKSSSPPPFPLSPPLLPTKSFVAPACGSLLFLPLLLLKMGSQSFLLLFPLVYKSRAINLSDDSCEQSPQHPSNGGRRAGGVGRTEKGRG